MLTRNGALVVAAAVVAHLGGRALGLRELHALATVALLSVVVALVWVRVARPTVAAARSVSPAQVPWGEPARVDLELIGTGRVASPLLSLVDPLDDGREARLRLAPLARGTRAATSYRLAPRGRGPVHVGPLRAQVTDPLRLARRSTEIAPLVHAVVLPRIDPLPSALGGRGADALPTDAAPRPRRRGGDELRSLRPYQVGDDLRRVHWPTTARLDEMVVRVDGEDDRGSTAVLLDTRASLVESAEFEEMVSAAASLLVAAASEGRRVRLGTTAGFDSGWVEGARGLRDVLGSLALVVPGAGAGQLTIDADVVLTAEPETARRAAVEHLVVAFGPAAAADLDTVLRVRPGERLVDLWAAPTRAGVHP